MTITSETSGSGASLSGNRSTSKKSSACFSYLIRPTAPCVLGTEDYDEKSDDDEFFITAGGIIHSCPNVYQLSITNSFEHRKLQSCDALLFSFQKPTRSIDHHLNTYATESDRYAILPRFQANASAFSFSADSINSEIELYRERHARGLCRTNDGIKLVYSSFLPDTWRSDNSLLVTSVLHRRPSLSASMNSIKRSRSFEIII